ncbi:hypothetical protein CBM2586_A110091 [Cupriavidus phytorum]|uniref:Uncharacterized protein n=1 Tax=Cupriavidus taiwanensis TaxID=164546 RepID=A0A975X6G2_9BURK|nr:hypothetical protein CBM2586_A110091 [Cupriavidus taiwanensis]
MKQRHNRRFLQPHQASRPQPRENLLVGISQDFSVQFSKMKIARLPMETIGSGEHRRTDSTAQELVSEPCNRIWPDTVLRQDQYIDLE